MKKLITILVLSFLAPATWADEVDASIFDEGFSVQVIPTNPEAFHKEQKELREKQVAQNESNFEVRLITLKK